MTFIDMRQTLIKCERPKRRVRMTDMIDPDPSRKLTVRPCPGWLPTMFLFAALLLPVVLQAQYAYTTNNGALTITSFTGGGAVIIPSTANGLPVTSIGEASFEDNFSLTSVVIPDSITNIGDEAFSDCYSLTSVTLGTNVLDIGSHAFEYCSRLADVTIPASVTNIELEAFVSCAALTNLTVAAQNPAYSSINGVLFNQGATILEIYPQALMGAYSVPGSVTNIAEYAFDECNRLTSITNDNSLVSIGSAAFSGCFSLTNITLPGSLTSISNAAFAFCTNLTSVAIPASLTNIQTGVFAECFSLTNCTVAAQNPAYSSTNGVVFDKNQAALIVYPAGLAGAYVVPASVTSIADGAFAYCTRLWNITFPDGLTSIGIQSFYGCSSLTNAPFPSSLAGIGAAAFYYCTSLRNAGIGNGVATIGSDAFGACTSLTNATIGNGVISLGDGAFEYCSSLEYASIGNSATNIGLFEFMNCSSLTSITIGDSVASIGAEAFENCYSLTNLLFLGNAPANAGYGAFINVNRAATVYYEAGSTGWGTSYGGAFDAPVNVPAGILPTVMVENGPPPVHEGMPGVFADEFGFTITGASNEVVVVQVSTNLLNWLPLQTNTLAGTPLIFSDPNWRNYPHRFYRLMGQ